MTATQLAQAQAALVAGRFQDALRTAEAVLVHAPSDLNALSIKVNAAIRLDDADALLDALTRLHALRPDDAAIRRNLATTLNRRGNRSSEANRFAEAETHWRAAIEIEPNHREARFNLAGALRRAGNWQGSLCLYEALDREVPESAVSVGIADCLAMAGRNEDAAARLRATRITDDLRDSAVGIATRCGPASERARASACARASASALVRASASALARASA